MKSKLASGADRSRRPVREAAAAAAAAGGGGGGGGGGREDRKPIADDVVAPASDRTNFVGRMQQLVLNGHEYFEMASAGNGRNIQSTAALERPSGSLNFPLTFRSPDAYLVAKMKLYGTFTIYLQVFLVFLPSFVVRWKHSTWYADICWAKKTLLFYTS